jgi:membrane-associated phospholipid phosphatase
VLTIYVVILSLLGYWLLNDDKVSIHKTINAFVGNQWIDVFFKYITHFGDGIFAVILVLILAYYNFRNAIFILLSYTLASIVATIFKRIIYPDIFRPDFTFKFFVGEKLNLIDGIEMLSSNSFPSGHSTTAFAVFVALAFLVKSNASKFLFLVTACVVAFSRTYISQHWLIDIYVASVIGTLSAVLSYYIVFIKSNSDNLNLPFQEFLKQKKRV